METRFVEKLNQLSLVHQPFDWLPTSMLAQLALLPNVFPTAFSEIWSEWKDSNLHCLLSKRSDPPLAHTLKNGLGGGIRTLDFQYPKLAHYQAVLHLDKIILIWQNKFTPVQGVGNLNVCMIAM